MANNFHTVIPTLSEAEVREYISNHMIYDKEAVDLAIAELAKRGKPLSEEEIASIRDDIARRDRLKEIKSEGDVSIFSGWKANIVTDESAPLLYSRRAVYLFSVLVAPVFGSVLLSINLRKLGHTIPIIYTLAFGVAYSILTIYLRLRIDYLTLLNMAASLVLTSLIWGTSIGKATRYRAKPIWIPLIIAITINLLFFLLLWKK